MDKCLPRLLALVLVTGLTGCQYPQYRIATAPSLRPVDAARPMVVFSQIQGEACGRDAVLGAIRKMKRLQNVDGYLEVVIEEFDDGDKRCAKATAYPFRYGASVETPTIEAGDESIAPLVVPGRTSSEPLPNACAAQCERISALLKPEGFGRSLLQDRCTQHCATKDQAFESCVQKALDANAAKVCVDAAGISEPQGGQ